MPERPCARRSGSHSGKKTVHWTTDAFPCRPLKPGGAWQLPRDFPSLPLLVCFALCSARAIQEACQSRPSPNPGVDRITAAHMLPAGSKPGPAGWAVIIPSLLRVQQGSRTPTRRNLSRAPFSMYSVTIMKGLSEGREADLSMGGQRSRPVELALPLYQRSRWPRAPGGAYIWRRRLPGG